MRIGVYLGRHSGGGGGIALYSRSLIRTYLDIIRDPASPATLFFYGESTVLTSELQNSLPVSGSARVVMRPLPERFGRKPGVLVDQLLLAYYSLRDRLDVLHSTPNFGPVASFARRIVTVHDLFQAYSPETHTGFTLNRFFYRALFAAQLPFVSRVVVDTPSVADEIRSRFGVPVERLTTIPLGLDDDIFEFLADPPANALVPPCGSAGYTLLLASSDPRKNLRRALAAWKETPGDLRASTLVVKLLDPGAESIVRSEIPDALASGDAHLLGWLSRTELFRCYLGARVLLFPSLAEGYGFPAVEALALGCRLVSPSLDCLQGIPADGIFNCDSQSVRSIALALRSAMESRPLATPEDRLLRAQKNAPRFPSMKVAMRNTFEIYRELAPELQAVPEHP